VVPQGSILGPLLFIIYINDLPEACNDILAKIYLYADDAKIYKHVRDSGDADILQQEINNIKGWADQWLLKLNISKCKSASFTTKYVVNTKYHIIHNSVCHEMEKVDSYKDLGVTFDKRNYLLKAHSLRKDK